jgi:hypothetical protein
MITLPTERSTVESYNPKLLIIGGRPKTGKSSFVASIDNNLIIDLEDGYRSLSVMKVQARSVQDLLEIKDAIIAKGKELHKAPYRFITIDNATRLEEMSLSFAAQLYRNTPMGQSWGLLKDNKGMPIKDPKTNSFKVDPKADVRLLPNGSGYNYLRKAIRQCLDMFKPLCETLILVTHIKDKAIRKDGEEVSEMSIDLAGKLSDIVCGEADAVGMLYRTGNKTYLTFEGGEGTIREARPLHLRGKKFLVAESNEKNEVVFNSSEIFIN